MTIRINALQLRGGCLKNVFWAVLLLTISMQNAIARVVQVNEFTAQVIGNLLVIPSVDKALSTEQRIDLVSAEFLGIPYKARMLVGSPSSEEQLIVDFSGVDCLTFLEYVNALRRSSSYAGFIENLIRTRYAGGRIGYTTRRHFFTDWSTVQPLNAKDITLNLSSHAVTVTKYLNRGGDGHQLVPGLQVVKRIVNYVPSEFVDRTLLDHLHTGDYVGVYSPSSGLDVTHTGIYVLTEKGPFLRNASLRIANRKVVDSPFMDYIKGIPGIVVLRPI